MATVGKINRARRNLDIVRLRNTGLAIEQIANQVELTPERVRQILRESEQHESSLQTDGETLIDVKLEVLSLHNDGASCEEIAAQFGATSESVRQVIEESRITAPKRLQRLTKDAKKTLAAHDRERVRRLLEEEPEQTTHEISKRLQLKMSDVRTLQRHVEIERRRNEGQTLEEIAQHFGVTRERIRQILRKIGGPSASELRSRRHADRDAADDANRKRVIELLERKPGVSMREVTKHLGLCANEIRRLAPSHARRLITDEVLSTPVTQRWSDKEILGAIQYASTYEFPLSASTFGKLVARGEIRGPSVPLVYLRFGSWTSACATAGVESGTSFVENYESRWTDDDLLGFVLAYLMAPDSAGTFRGYEVWSKQEESDAPSAGTIRVRLGPWKKVKKMALQQRAELSRETADD